MSLKRINKGKHLSGGKYWLYFDLVHSKRLIPTFRLLFAWVIFDLHRLGLLPY